MSCDSWETNAAFDIVPIPNQADHMDPISNYLGHNISKFINHPYASPLFGDFRGLPPLLIQAGDSEVLRDESRLLSMKAAAAGVLVKYEVYKDAVSSPSLAFSIYTTDKLLRSMFFRTSLFLKNLRKHFELVANLLKASRPTPFLRTCIDTIFCFSLEF